jgi:5-methylcytosine-specific restriction endonuclease McrA
MKYATQLKDPRWQKKRLEIMERDKFKCVLCDSGDKTLHIHHYGYEKNLKPWEYSNDRLATLCEDCHNERQQLENSMILSLRVFNNEVLASILDDFIKYSQCDMRKWAIWIRFKEVKNK